MIIRGVKRSKGEYEGNKYDNIILHCLSDNDGTMLAGDPVEIVKVPYPIFMNFLGGSELDAAIGMDVRFAYNKYGKVDEVILK